MKLRFCSLLSVLVLATSCASSSPAVEHARIDRVDYFVPSGWLSRDLGTGTSRTPIVEWTPPDNGLAKESVTVTRSAPLEALTKAGPDYVERLLEQAQRTLPRGKFGKPIRFTTKNGFVGVRVEGDFIPPGRTTAYHRIHAVVIDQSSLIHVMYTAAVADREAFEIVIDSLDRKDG